MPCVPGHQTAPACSHVTSYRVAMSDDVRRGTLRGNDKRECPQQNTGDFSVNMKLRSQHRSVDPRGLVWFERTGAYMQGIPDSNLGRGTDHADYPWSD